MIEIESKYEFKVGDKVYYIDHWGTLRSGVIYAIGAGCATTVEGKIGGVMAGAKLKDCWPSKEECLDAEKRRAALQKEEYKKSIKTVEDLVRFMYFHDIHSESPDWDAKAAVDERIAEMGISIKE